MSCSALQVKPIGLEPVWTGWLLLSACLLLPSIRAHWPYPTVYLCVCVLKEHEMRHHRISPLPSYKNGRRAFLEEVDKVYFTYSWGVLYHKWQCLLVETSHPALAVSQTVPTPTSHTPYLSLTDSRCVRGGWLVVALCCQGTMPQSCISPPHGLHLPFSAWLSPICCPLPRVGGQQMGQETGTWESKFFREGRRESVRSEEGSSD